MYCDSDESQIGHNWLYYHAFEHRCTRSFNATRLKRRERITAVKTMMHDALQSIPTFGPLVGNFQLLVLYNGMQV